MKTGLVVGSASCVWNDLVAAHKLRPRFDAIAVVNAMGAEFEDPVDYWVTLHPEKMIEWQSARKARGYAPAKQVVANDIPSLKERGVAYPHIDRKADYRFSSCDEHHGSGSSGLFAVKVLLDDGFERVVLAGVPMQAEGLHFDSKEPWYEVSAFTKTWEAVQPILNGRVKSMSGWTRDLLGCPTQAWLSGT